MTHDNELKLALVGLRTSGLLSDSLKYHWVPAGCPRRSHQGCPFSRGNSKEKSWRPFLGYVSRSWKTNSFIPRGKSGQPIQLSLQSVSFEVPLVSGKILQELASSASEFEKPGALLHILYSLILTKSHLSNGDVSGFYFLTSLSIYENKTMKLRERL